MGPRQLLLTAATLFAAAGGAAADNPLQALTANLFGGLQNAIHRGEGAQDTQARISRSAGPREVIVGARIRVNNLIIYNNPQHPEYAYNLTAGMTGTVEGLDGGDAKVRWDDIGLRWLLKQ
eukprot:CAMPEP_0195114196 /NCGR_PEP_ID=MMETSP0448-20130528/105290_1 /TAXON_ID=66468 /ORGANISM="Heterocapsa triquestra, Strain CCMP 448" /LENGTH=120 /DNA_ID=CAMNT_0040151215 /DNA_START=46 /DNA_END=405 /DNA_ORIENTATION=+